MFRMAFMHDQVTNGMTKVEKDTLKTFTCNGLLLILL